MSTADPSLNDRERDDYGEARSAPRTTGHPPALYFMFWGEFAERASYYGMRTILFLYLTTQFGLSDAVAGSTYSYFKAACYFLPLLGGFLAEAGTPVTDLEVEEQNLERVFLHLTGTALRDDAE